MTNTKMSQTYKKGEFLMKHFSESRGNFNARIYVSIAAKNYLRATQQLTDLKARVSCPNAPDFFDEIYGDVSQSAIVTIVFSALAVESFINDYSCRIMGDKFFYDNFQSLAPIAKLQLCYKIVTGDAIDIGTCVCYSKLKKLTKLRNEYVHSKSSHVQGYSAEEYAEYSAWKENGLIPETTFEDCVEWGLENLEREVNQAYDALRTIFELAILIDSIDEDAYAEVMLFNSRNGEEGEFVDQNIKVVYQLFYQP